MNEAGSRGRVRLGELIDAALAPASPDVHAGFVGDLAAVTRSEEAQAAVAERCLAAGESGRLVLLEWMARLRGRASATLVELAPHLFGIPGLPEEVIVRAAAHTLRSSRRPKVDRPRILAAVTAGLRARDALARLRAIQGRLRRSRALDALIERRERRQKVRCPRCATKFARVDLPRHLYEAHGLVLDRGLARSPERVAKQLRRAYKAGRDTTLLDRAAGLTDPATLRAWAARTGARAADATELTARAAERGCGVCPRCFGELAPSLDLLPPPLALASNRVAGDGYALDVRGPGGVGVYRLAVPTGDVRTGFDAARLLGPRGLGVAVAAGVLAAAIATGLAPHWALPLAAGGYAAARRFRAPLPPARDRAIDLAWAVLAPDAVRAPDGGRLLTRLCRASVGHGDLQARARILHRVAQIEGDVRLRVAARFLRIDDESRLGVDRVAAVGGMIADGLGGAEPLAFAEHAAELFLRADVPPMERDRARLRVLALEAAFDAGYTPRALADLWAAVPALRALTATEPLSRLGLLYAVWTLRDEQPWASVAAVGTAFELARGAPTLGGRLLAEHPDLLLYWRPPPAIDDALGFVLVGARGVVIGGEIVADPEAEIAVAGGRVFGSATLALGPHRFTLARRPPADFIPTLRQLLRLRARVILPRLDAALAPAPTPDRVADLARLCACGARVLVSAGRVGRLVRATRGGGGGGG